MGTKSFGISLAEYIAIKGDSVADVCCCARRKGFDIPAEPNYVLSLAELKAIDPVFAYNLKYRNKHTVASGASGDSSGNASGASTPATPVKGDDQAATDDKQGVTSESIVKPSLGAESKDVQRVIGIVKFFDANKGWGFVVANSLGFPKTALRALFSVHLTESEWKGASAPKKGEWIVLTPRRKTRGWSAMEAEPLTYNQQGLLLAMKYQGAYAKIEGTNKDEYFNRHVLCHVINQMTLSLKIAHTLSLSHDPARFADVIACFCLYLEQMPKTRQRAVIKVFLGDDRLRPLLFKVFIQGVYEPENSRQAEVYRLFHSALVDELLKNGKVTDLAKLPATFDYNGVMDRLVPLLVREAKTDPDGVRDWLSEHSLGDPVSLDKRDCETIPLRVILCELTHDRNWITEFEADWSDVREFIKANVSLSYRFCKVFFLGVANEWVREHEVVDLLDEDLIRKWATDLMREEEVPVGFLRVLLEQSAHDQLDLWCAFVRMGYALAPSYPVLATALNRSAKLQVEQVLAFFACCEEKGVSYEAIFTEGVMDDAMCVILFIQTGERTYLERVKDLPLTVDWVAGQTSSFVLRFIRSYGLWLLDTGAVESDTCLRRLGGQGIAAALKLADVDEQLDLLRCFPTADADTIVGNYFMGSSLFERYAGAQWEALKREFSYVVFDLESDGDQVREFAFHTAGQTHYHEGEASLGTLVEVINSTPIVVGHRIKQWDLEILNRQATLSPGFVWDTLEVEILLNPCRYTYALHTQHTAKADTELTDRLFWNQLFRLAEDVGLCSELAAFLPGSIADLVARLRQPLLIAYYRQLGDAKEVFFQNPLEVDEELRQELAAINESEGSCLIIAPKRLWSRIAAEVVVSFVSTDTRLDFLHLSAERIEANPLPDAFLQMVLLRYCRMAMSPVVAGLSDYLRAQYFKDELLQPYVVQVELPVRCADLSVMDALEDLGNYATVYFVGCELENRLNQYTAPTTLRPADFWEERSSIPMRLGGSSYTSVSREERRSPLFKEVPDDAANVWIERNKEGLYLVNYNFNIYQKIRRLHSQLSGSVTIHQIPWTSGVTDNRSVFLVRSGRQRPFDGLQKRVNASSRYRAMYWLYQLALLTDIHFSVPSMPILYILEDDLELSEVAEYARALGFYVPQEGTLMAKLERIAKRSDGLLVIPKERFFEVVQKKLYTPYCYVWDQLAVEKHRMMWQALEAPIGEGLLDDPVKEGEQEEQMGSSEDTYQAVLCQLWPVYQYYSRFILANHAGSRMYILDSFMEEYHTLGDVWNTSQFVSGQLWRSENSFKEGLVHARRFFGEGLEAELSRGEDWMPRAMEVILQTLVPPGRDGVRRWKEIQQEVLPQILSKAENYLVSMPTGGGKSVLFQGPALYNASYNNHLSLVITPLKALMKDQVHELAQKGFYTNVDFLNEDRSYQEVRSIYRKVNSGELALLYVTPERFRSRAFLNALYTRMTHDQGLEYVVFDEAHCISQWGMEFRPEYLNVIKRCKEFQEVFPKGLCIAMFSATVTDMIYRQINEQVPVLRLGQANDRKLYNPIRSHIGMTCRPVDHDKESRLMAIVDYIHEQRTDFRKSRMLVFCKMRNQCEELAASLPELLVREGILPKEQAEERVGYFHAGMDSEDRDEVYRRFKSENDPIFILCATKAFGMGMDIPNIHYIVHFSPPNVLEDYLQEVGRAGRDKTMYEEAGFSEQYPIPTVCLYSTEDIKKAREQLLQSGLSWPNLEELRQTVCDYIVSIQSLKATREHPVVVPCNLWSGAGDHSFTDYRLGMYWLERLGRIRMGYLCPAHLKVKLGECSIDDCSQFDTKGGALIRQVYASVSRLAQQKGVRTLQVSLQEVAGSLSVSTTKVLNALIACTKAKLLYIEQEVRCRITKTRMDEVPYLLEHPNVEVALHAILRATAQLLGANMVNCERSYFDWEIQEFIDLSSMEPRLKSVVKRNANGSDETVSYMPWYNERDKRRNMGLSQAEHYKRDLYEKRFRQIFSTLLDIIPHVRCRSYIDREQRCVKQSLLVEEPTWKKFLPVFEQDCLRTLSYIYRLPGGDERILKWDEAIIDLGLEAKGFRYFEHILRYLSGMAYIVTESLLPTGIEVYTTEDTERPIPDDVPLSVPEYKHKQDFDEAVKIRVLRLYVMDVLTTRVHDKRELQELISAYFNVTSSEGLIQLLSRYYEDNHPIWERIREEAIQKEEERMRGNAQQWAIYSASSSTNILVEAGPGSGKTHVLTMRCAKLIYRQGVKPSQILVLAYNRAVVVELKERLNSLFSSLGLSRSASQLHVYTFHELALRVCGKEALEGLALKEWEQRLLLLLRERPQELFKRLGSIQYILIDELQDITQTRLDALFELDALYNHPSFFAIGDKDQSIYGFEKLESMDPEFFFRQLREQLHPQLFSMRINYRSYPKILQLAAGFLADPSRMPEACEARQKAEPETEYTFKYGCERSWVADLKQLLTDLKKKGTRDVALFFRTNNEVYNGYAQVRTLNLPDVRIRIQGASECELFRKREIYSVIHYLEKAGDKPLVFEGQETQMEVRDLVTRWIQRFPNWDVFYLDFAYTLVINYLEVANGSESQLTYGDMALAIKQSLEEDNPQLYKLYEKYRDKRILRDEQMNVILTTMHKVKGLQFDAVIITPSVASLPLITGGSSSVNVQEQIEEERRLLYVAYTRAKDYLAVYEGPREQAVARGVAYTGNTASLGIHEKEPRLANYDIGYVAGNEGFPMNGKVLRQIAMHAPVTVERCLYNRGGYWEARYELISEGMVLGRLSRSSSIRQAMERGNLSRLQGFFVSDVFSWTYEDTLRADQKNGTNFARRWCAAAQEKKVVFLVSIAGFGRAQG